MEKLNALSSLGMQVRKSKHTWGYVYTKADPQANMSISVVWVSDLEEHNPL